LANKKRGGYSKYDLHGTLIFLIESIPFYPAFFITEILISLDLEK